MLEYILYSATGKLTASEAYNCAVNTPNTIEHKYKSEAEDIIRLFFPEYSLHELSDKLSGKIVQACVLNNKILTNHILIEIDGKSETLSRSDALDYEPQTTEFVRYYKRIIKHSLYLALLKFMDKAMPWGSLTGIRPTRIGYELLHDGDYLSAEQSLRSLYGVSADKARLTVDVMRSQEGFYDPSGRGAILYVNIPVCKTRCNYCSFISAVYGKCKHLLEEYTQLLTQEIKHSVESCLSAGVKIKSIYIGGGTPTAIGQNLLELIVRTVREAIGDERKEFCVEAGRPEGIDEDLLKMLNQYGVTRISINPQTFQDATLIRIGRGHTSADVYRAYERASRYPMTINMDLIAGLDGESVKDFESSLDHALGLQPHNITVHSLSIKGGSKLKEKGAVNHSGVTSMMTEIAYKRLKGQGYLPYYLYRQKYTLGNTENTGYTLKGHACAYNIDAMEECASVIACGAGAISKVLGDGGSIKRLANFKNFEDYISRFGTVMERKDELISQLIKNSKR